MPPPLHTPALGTDTWHSHCGSETRRSTTLLLGSVLLVRKAHALALDNGRYFRPLVLPVHQEPGEDDRGYCTGQQADACAITNPVRRPKFRLVDLWPLTRYTVSYAGVSAPSRWCARVGGNTYDDAHQLCHTLRGNSRVSQSFLCNQKPALSVNSHW